MFQVQADSLTQYLNFDPVRRVDLKKLDQLLQVSAPGLERYFHRGSPAGEPGMRFRMIGYGKYHYLAKAGKSVEWPAIGVALQKNYISVYVSLMKEDAPLVQSYAGKLGALKMGHNNFSFEAYDDLDVRQVGLLFAEADRIFRADPRRSVQARGKATRLAAR